MIVIPSANECFGSWDRIGLILTRNKQAGSDA